MSREEQGALGGSAVSAARFATLPDLSCANRLIVKTNPRSFFMLIRRLHLPDI